MFFRSGSVADETTCAPSWSASCQRPTADLHGVATSRLDALRKRAMSNPVTTVQRLRPQAGARTWRRPGASSGRQLRTGRLPSSHSGRGPVGVVRDPAALIVLLPVPSLVSKSGRQAVESIGGPIFLFGYQPADLRPGTDPACGLVCGLSRQVDLAARSTSRDEYCVTVAQAAVLVIRRRPGSRGLPLWPSASRFTCW